MVFILSPQVTEMALEFKEHLDTFGIIRSSDTGRKGLHVLTPIEPKWSFQEAFEARRPSQQPFVEAHGSKLTLQIKKDARRGKVCWTSIATAIADDRPRVIACAGWPARRVFNALCSGSSCCARKARRPST